MKGWKAPCPRTQMGRRIPVAGLALAGVAALLTGCGDTPNSPEQLLEPEVTAAHARGGPMNDPGGSAYTFDPPVYDIDAAPDGSILVARSVFGATHPSPGQSSTVIHAIRRSGSGGIRDVVEILTPAGVPINGLAAAGRGSFFAARGGLDLAYAAAVLHVSDGGARVVGDIEAFETRHDPDATAGLAWKDPACEASGPYSAGPQSNPYHLTRVSGNTVLVADAAGNALLRVEQDGGIVLVAVFTPPVSDGSGSTDPGDWVGLFPGCYVQPVPTSVAIGPDDALYVGELTGLHPANFEGEPVTGLSRVWRIAPGAEGVTCPSDDCQVVLSGLTSVIDLAFGPDGMLHVLEYDENGWAIATAAVGGTPDPAGGTLSRCDVVTGTCTVVEGGLALPGALAFDRWGHLWLLEDNIGTPTVRVVD